jgi:hypothetical protein
MRRHTGLNEEKRLKTRVKVDNFFVHLVLRQ